jgi:dienelactone hydrolase
LQLQVIVMSRRILSGRSLAIAAAILMFGYRNFAAEPAFRTRQIDASSTYNACAAMDINRDGKLDIIAGGFWYEAPTWQKHFVRDVERIRGRFDDYAHLPLDVNGDGWIDYVSANYRSQSIYWVENPGPSPESWRKHVVDTPGPMETGRLYDIDGDGQPDLLPNGVTFAAWWQMVRPSDSREKESARWIRHELPNQLAGHGIGCGDVNGDGRADVVGWRGWAEAPLDRRTQRWQWHGDFQLDRDAGIPILVSDVDLDGDSDLIWGRGHNIGLFWIEQQIKSDARSWIRHAIDTSWSQPHSLLFADVDNDGRADVIAGKRYMGHDGQDPGEYDPIVAYWYEFDTGSRAWKRHDIAIGGSSGLGLDPKAIDIDADGDIDIVGSDRNGLVLFENLLIGASGEQPPAAPSTPKYADHTRLLVVADPNGTLAPVNSPFDWATRRIHILAGMQEAMGPLPDPSMRVPLDVQYHESERMEKYTRHRISYQPEPGDRVPAYLLIPHGFANGPAMLCLHQTTRLGKGEPVGFGDRTNLRYAHELAERGYVCLAADYPSFGDYSYDFQAHVDRYPSGSMKAIWNNLRAVDLLQALPGVDRDKIGCIGHSLGGHNGLFTAAFDQRIAAVVTSCGFTAFHNYYGGNLAGWTSDRYMPRIREIYHNDPNQVPFDFHEVIASLAPRPIFVNAPLRDANFDVEGVKQVLAAAADIYELRSARDQIHAEYPDCEHDFPPDVRYRAYDWLDDKLKGVGP